MLSLAYIPAARDTVWLALPLAPLAVCLVAGLSLAVASLNALYRDVEHLIAALLLPWFFLTPVLYSLEGIPAVSDYPRVVDVLHWGNPLTPAIEAVRDPLFFGTPPSTGDAVYLAVSAVLALALGSYVFLRVDDRVRTELDPAVEDPRLLVRSVSWEPAFPGSMPASRRGEQQRVLEGGIRRPPGAHGRSDPAASSRRQPRAPRRVPARRPVRRAAALRGYQMRRRYRALRHERLLRAASALVHRRRPHHNHRPFCRSVEMSTSSSRGRARSPPRRRVEVPRGRTPRSPAGCGARHPRLPFPLRARPGAPTVARVVHVCTGRSAQW